LPPKGHYYPRTKPRLMSRERERERERERKGPTRIFDDQHYYCLSPFPVEHTKGDFQQLLLVLSAVAAVLLFVCRFSDRPFHVIAHCPISELTHSYHLKFFLPPLS